LESTSIKAACKTLMKLSPLWSQEHKPYKKSFTIISPVINLQLNFNNLRKFAKHLTWPFVPLVRHQVGNNCLIVRQPEVENPCPIVSRILSKSQQVTRSSISFQMWRSRRYSLRGIGCLLLLGYKVFISPTFYEQLFHVRMFFSQLLYDCSLGL